MAEVGEIFIAFLKVSPVWKALNEFWFLISCLTSDDWNLSCQVFMSMIAFCSVRCQWSGIWKKKYDFDWKNCELSILLSSSSRFFQCSITKLKKFACLLFGKSGYSLYTDCRLAILQFPKMNLKIFVYTVVYNCTCLHKDNILTLLSNCTLRFKVKDLNNASVCVCIFVFELIRLFLLQLAV